jgi:lipid A 4'-phosphatase
MIPTTPLHSALQAARWPLRRFASPTRRKPKGNTAGEVHLDPILINADRQAARLLGCILFCFAVFAIWPEVDLWISDAFHDPATGFAIAGNPLTEAIRLAIWNVAILFGLACAFGTAIGMAGRTLFLPSRVWGFILTLYVLGPGIMVEMLTKPLWGRARPVQLAEFGGSLPFSPANELVGVCVRNCSFVSGEVSGATVTAIALMIFRFYLMGRLHKWVSTLLLTIAWCLPLVVGLQRLGAGRHFLSDAVFAVLFTLLLALVLSEIFRRFPRRVLWVRRRHGTVPADRW